MKYYLLIIILLIILFLFITNKILRKTENKEHFEEEIDIYDKEFAEFYEIIYRDYSDIDYDYKIVEKELFNKLQIDDPSSLSILVAGSGTGKLCKKIKEKYDNVQGVDNSKSMILLSKKMYPNIKFLKENLCNKESFSNKQYSIIWLDERTLNYQNFDEQKKILNNCYEWLDNQGFLIICLYDKNELQIGARNYSMNYIDDKGNVHTFTYLNNFSHDGYYIRDSDPNVYQYYDKIVLQENLKKRIKKTTFYFYDKEKLYQHMINIGFDVFYIESPRDEQIMGGYELAILRKRTTMTTVEELENKKINKNK